jgi:hypothetical protein
VGALMDLVAGDAREILLAIGVDDWRGLSDRSRFAAHLALGGRMDPSWLDLLALACREVTGGDSPGSFTDACRQLDDRRLARLGSTVDATVERVEPRWVDDMAALHDRRVDAVAARWVELIDCEACAVDAEDKPTLRSLVEELIVFCRLARSAEDVLFVWSI